MHHYASQNKYLLNNILKFNSLDKNHLKCNNFLLQQNKKIYFMSEKREAEKLYKSLLEVNTVVKFLTQVLIN